MNQEHDASSHAQETDESDPDADGWIRLPALHGMPLTPALQLAASLATSGHGSGRVLLDHRQIAGETGGELDQ